MAGEPRELIGDPCPDGMLYSVPPAAHASRKTDGALSRADARAQLSGGLLHRNQIWHAPYFRQAYALEARRIQYALSGCCAMKRAEATEPVRFVRAIFAILIAWSVAMAPNFSIAAASLPSGAPSPHHSRSHTHPDAALAHEHHRGPELGIAGRCCDDEERGPEHGLPGDCSTMPGCALKSFSLAPVFAANLAEPITLSTPLVWYPSPVILPETPAPPLRPPRS